MNRRTMLTGLGATLMTSACAAPSAWQSIAPSEAGLAADLGERIDAAQRSGALPGLHGVVIARHGRLALERYYSGVDQSWGTPLGEVAFDAGTLHDLRSATKSIVGLLYGIALADGLAPPPDAVLVDQFPEYADLVADPMRRRITIAHVLSMTLGVEWKESLDYTSNANAEIAMEQAPDRYRLVLERPIVEPPGQHWHYCGGATALLGRLIAKGTGMTLPEFAQRRLFAPLGIADFHWVASADGTPSAASGLRLRPRDLTRIGQLVLQRGQWVDQQIVPAAWIEASTRPVVTIQQYAQYGLHWYLSPYLVGSHAGQRPEKSIGAAGNGGQRLYVFPGLDLAVAITAGNYDRPDQAKLPNTVLREFVLPSVVAG